MSVEGKEEVEALGLWQELGVKALSVESTESELQVARKAFRSEREKVDQNLFNQIAATCSTSGQAQGGADLEELFRLDFTHLEHALGSKFKALLKEYTTCIDNISSSRDRIESVEKVADWWSNFEECGRYRSKAEYSNAVKVLQKLNLSDGDGLENLPGRETFEKEFSLLSSSIIEEIDGHLLSLVQYQSLPSGGKLSICTSSQNGHTRSPSDLWSACSTLNIVANQLERMSTYLDENVFGPVFQNIDAFKIRSTDENSVEWIFADSMEGSTCISNLLDYATLLRFVWHSVYGQSQDCRESALNIMWYPLERVMRSIWLESITKESLYSSSTYPNLIASLDALENALESENILMAENKILSRYVKGHFEALSQEMQRKFLGKARRLIVEEYGKGTGDTILVGDWGKNTVIADLLVAQQYSSHQVETVVELHADQLPSDKLPLVEFGSLSISSVSAELASVLETVMEEAANCSNILLAEKFIEIVSDIVMLWVHLPTMLHKQELENVAHFVMRYFNDTMYIAGTITSIACKWHDLVSECGMVSDLATKIDYLRKVAFSHSYAQVRERTLELQSLVSANKFFRKTHKPNQEKKVREAIIEIRIQIERLASIWKSNLAPAYFAKFLGAVLENLCTYIYAEIMSMEDISVRETEVLPTLLLELLGQGLKPFLQRKSPGETSPIDQEALFRKLFQKYAPAWTKLCVLVDLFSMSLQDIVNNWMNQQFKSKGFTSDEIIHFVTIVFEDSDFRSEKIATILQDP